MIWLNYCEEKRSETIKLDMEMKLSYIIGQKYS